VRATYEDPWIAGMLHVRRLHAMGLQVRDDEWAAWVVRLWAELEGVEQERRRVERERAEAGR